MLKGILNYAHHLLEESINKGELVIDATCGNGNDTVFLSELVGREGHVLAFDIQEQAIQNTKNLLNDNEFNNVSVIHDSHAQIEKYFLEKNYNTIGGAVFNLGYLPRSDKTIITKGQSTITSVNTILQFLKKNGLVVIVVYHGHEGGKDEKEMILKHVINLDQKKYNVLKYGFINQKNNPPFIIAIQKK